LEVIFTVLNALANHKEALKELGPYGIYLNSFIQKRHLLKLIHKNDLTKIRRTTERTIAKSLEKYNNKKAKTYYDSLFELPKNLNSWYKTRTGKTCQPPLFEHIVTTNYDRVIEDWFEQSHGRPPRRGFAKEERTEQQYLDKDRMIRGEYNLSTNNYIEYLKLHGSIDWWIRSDNKIILRETSSSLRRERYRNRLMIYPVYDKHVAQDPFFSLYYYFKYLLLFHEVYLVIGYSFRDPAINYAFREALINKTSSRMIIVTPNVKKIRDKASKNFPSGTFDLIEGSFGDEDLISKLVEKLET
jgi:hypothetical protein